ncbi:PBSX family phage terminase large subunit [Catenuloplanes nepalensis]|uniref:PBSX family phage terminase large subunit n=1 Tax=Catenuloplanes nepalensis TaxID=587533 RepID=A0ABT9N6N2_9ACTN|nr:PBSX family phage terminase large subunit [Catenuloplanes nepalensis]MDP9799357.1 PBSX family phage terminase large subunit [Catenuloplanes nepalensis]
MTGLRGLALSEKQIDFALDSDTFVNLAEGAVRSGKTISGLLRWAKYIATDAPKSGDLVVCAKTYDTATRNIFNPLRDSAVFGPLAKATSYTRGAPTAMILGQQVEVITFNDERSEARLRGMTSRGAYVDEWSLMPRTFHEQLLGRHSVDGSQIFGNTNPDNPRHWLKTEGIDQAKPGGRLAGDWKVWHFGLDDNPGLSERVKERYRRQYTGLYYRRNILGEWCVAEGTVYESWDPARHVVKELPGITRWISLGVDYGTVNPFAGLLLGVGTDGKLYLAREWRWDSKKEQRSLTDAEYSARLRGWLNQLQVQPDWVCVDPSAASFKTQLFNDGLMPIAADNAVADGIRLVASLLAEGLLFVHESCAGWIEEIPGYVWDEKAALLGEDKPVKAGDHSLDAGRYAIKTPEVLWRPLVRGVLDLAA